MNNYYWSKTVQYFLLKWNNLSFLFHLIDFNSIFCWAKNKSLVTENVNNSLLPKTKVALTSLLITLGAFSYGQTATQGKTDTKIEQLTTTDDPKAKADVDTLMKKYNVATLDDIKKLPVKGIESMRTELLILLQKNASLSYLASTKEFQEKLRSNVELYADDNFDFDWNQKALDAIYELAKNKDELAKNKDELAKNKDELDKAKKENEEVRQVSQQFGINK